MNKHPKALAMLFFTEMWERFSFYGMRALLTLYLTLQLFKDLMEPNRSGIAYGIYAAYGALLYATPFLGGLIADKYLGHKKAIVWGAILMTIGHFVMAIESEFFLYLALSFLILGNGFFKPNISSIVGQLYNKGDIRRDGGFTIFYMGVNLGAFFSPIICGTIGEIYGWHYGFGIAGFGMIAGLIIFNKFKYLLDFKESLIQKEDSSFEIKKIPADIGNPPSISLLKKKVFLNINTENSIYILSFALVAFISLLFHNFEIMSNALTIFTIGVLIAIFIIALKSPKIDRDRLFVILILFFFNTLFWAFFEQAGSSFTLFTNGNIDRTIGDALIPASAFQSVNPFFILIFGTPITMLWLFLAKKKKEPGTPQKFAIGLFLLSIGFLIFGLAPYFISSTKIEFSQQTYNFALLAATVPMIFIIVSYLFQTLGELCQSPVGLSMITKLAPPKMVAMIMGAWFLSFSMSHHFAGIISKTTTTETSVESEILSYFTSNLNENAINITKEDFTKNYSSIFSKVISNGFEVVQVQGNEINSTETSLFDYNQIIDSSLTQMKRLEIDNIISNKKSFSNALIDAYANGINVMILAGNKASKKAVEAEFINNKDASKFSITTLYSLSNLLQYTSVFYRLGIIALCAAGLLFLLAPFIKKMMHGA